MNIRIELDQSLDETEMVIKVSRLDERIQRIQEALEKTVKLKLYELEEILPRYFCRISKSTIANIKAIYALDKSFSGTSTVQFYNTHKQVHVSRHYYQLVKEKLSEVR